MNLEGTFAALPTTHYVNVSNPTPVWPYANWSTAAQRIQDAVDAASPGAIVLVAAGVYNSGGAVWEDSGLTNRVLINKALTLKSVSGAQATFIVGNSSTGLLACGDSAVRCLAIAAAPVFVSGFTLTNGHTRVSGGAKSIMGGGVWTTNTGSVVIADCRITGCAGVQEGGGGYGGIYSNCIISGNASWNGGGISQGLTVGCEVSENRGYSGAGGILYGTSVLSRIAFNQGGTMGGGCGYARVDRCTVERNASSGKGGGVYSCSDVRSSVIICNTSTVAGGGSYGSRLFNCTIVSNRSQSGGGVASSYLTNCIVYYNTAVSNINADSASTGRVNCIVLPPGVTWSGTITNAPRFAARSFRLRGNSPCINAGTNIAALAFCEGP